MGSDLIDLARDTLESNTVAGLGFCYTCPAPDVYPHQWLWDSCFHAIVWHAIGDADRAKQELRALFRHQVTEGLDHGRLPHMTFANPSEIVQMPRGADLDAYGRDRILWRNAHASTLTQPPIVADAVRRVGDLKFWRELWEPIKAYYAWWLRRRVFHNGLSVVWHPWETGADATPRVDAACLRVLSQGLTPLHLDTQTRNPLAYKNRALVEARFGLLQALHHIDDQEVTRAINEAEAQRERLQLLGLLGVDMQAYLYRNLCDLIWIGEQLGKHQEVNVFRSAALDLKQAFHDLLWHEQAGFYFDRVGPLQRTVYVKTFAPFIAFYAYDLIDEQQASRLLTSLTDPAQFWTQWPVPSVSRDEPTFEATQYWRGSTWMNINWMVIQGLLDWASKSQNTSFFQAGQHLKNRSQMLLQDGVREFYGSEGTGQQPKGLGPYKTGWSTLGCIL